MAYRDRSQGIAFVYGDLHTLVQRAKEAPAEDAHIPVPVNDLPRQISLPVTSKEPKIPTTPVQGSTQDSQGAEWASNRTAALHQIRSNLDRLQSLHHKLHSMLSDINKLKKK